MRDPPGRRSPRSSREPAPWDSTVEHASALVPVLWVTGSPARIRRLASRDECHPRAVVGTDQPRARGGRRVGPGLARVWLLPSARLQGQRRPHRGRRVRQCLLERAGPRLDPGEPATRLLDGPGCPHAGGPSDRGDVDHRERQPLASGHRTGGDLHLLGDGRRAGRRRRPRPRTSARSRRSRTPSCPAVATPTSSTRASARRASPGSAAMRAYVDYVVRVYDVHVAAAAGNTVTQARCQGGGRLVVAPGTGLERRHGRRGGRPRDRALERRPALRRRLPGDPPGGTFKPEISAPAVRIGVNGASHTGTSFAAPQVAGAMALLIDQVEDLRTRPHVVKAILLAGSFLRRTVADRSPPQRRGRDARDEVVALGRGEQAQGRRRRGGLGRAGARFTSRRSTAAGRRRRSRRSRSIPIRGVASASWRAGRATASTTSRAGSGRMTTSSTVAAPTSTSSSARRRASGRPRPCQRSGRSRSSSGERVASELPYTVRVKPVDWDCDLASETVGWAWVAPR